MAQISMRFLKLVVLYVNPWNFHQNVVYSHASNQYFWLVLVCGVILISNLACAHKYFAMNSHFDVHFIAIFKFG